MSKITLLRGAVEAIVGHTSGSEICSSTEEDEDVGCIPHSHADACLFILALCCWLAGAILISRLAAASG